MGQKLSKQQAELYRRTDEVLHYIWDPIGVAGAPYARDEYTTYTSKVFSMLEAKEDKDEIVDYLVKVERDMMQLDPSVDNAKKVVDILLVYKKKLYHEEW